MIASMWGDWLNRWLPPEPAPEAPPPPTDRAILGEHARRLSVDPTLNLAWDMVIADLTASWQATAPGEREQREEQYRLLWAVKGARARLTALLGNAKVLEAERLIREREAERKRGAF